MQRVLVLSGQHGPEIFHQEHQSQFIHRRWFKTEVFVKTSGIVIDGMYQDGAGSGDVRCSVSPKQGLLEERFSKTLSGFPPVYCQTGQEKNRDRVPG